MASIEEELSDVDESTIPYETAFAGFLTTEAKLVDASLSEVATAFNNLATENSRTGPPISDIMGPYDATPGLSTSGQVYTITPGELHRLQGAAAKLNDVEEGYLLFDPKVHDLFFFPVKTFDQTFEAPVDSRKSLYVTKKKDHPNAHRQDSFLCNHEFYHTKSNWWPRDRLLVRSTYYFDSAKFMNHDE